MVVIVRYLLVRILRIVREKKATGVLRVAIGRRAELFGGPGGLACCLLRHKGRMRLKSLTPETLSAYNAYGAYLYRVGGWCHDRFGRLDV